MLQAQWTAVVFHPIGRLSKILGNCKARQLKIKPQTKSKQNKKAKNHNIQFPLIYPQF